MRAIARELHHGRRAIREVLTGDQPQPRRYRRRTPKPRPVLEPVMGLIDAWLTAERDRAAQAAPHRQTDSPTAWWPSTALPAASGSCASTSTSGNAPISPCADCFLPLAYAPGAEAQCDWGEAVVEIAGVAQTAALFCLRLCYSLQPFVCAFPTARQECFLAGHLAAFTALGGVPHRITYEYLGSAVTKILQGRTRQEHEQFVAFRGHYLFESHFCLPGRDGAHEKPLVESLVGYARRNFLVPVLAVDSWEALDRLLAERCAAEDGRTVPGRDRPIGMLWQEEQARLRPVPRSPFACCRTVAVKRPGRPWSSSPATATASPAATPASGWCCAPFPGTSNSATARPSSPATPGSTAGTASNSIRSTTSRSWNANPAGSTGRGRSSTGAPLGRRSTRTTWRRCARRARRRPRGVVRILQLHARYRPEAIAAALNRRSGCPAGRPTRLRS